MLQTGQAQTWDKVVRDPIYGYIGLTDEQRRVVDLPAFQRLRRVRQLSFADLVYPSATHTRFAHSLGTMELGRRAARGWEPGALQIPREWLEALEWTGLLHDVGHFPFSHAFEPVAARFGPAYLASDEPHDVHISWARRLIDADGYGIKEILGSDRVDRIVALLDSSDSGAPRPVKHIVTGRFSIDRLDYLQRDAHHAGTPEYGAIDYARILASPLEYRDADACVHAVAAQYAIEGAILSYFLMYRAVYYHHTVSGAYLLFQQLLWDAFESPGNPFAKVRWEDPGFWSQFDDYTCLSMLRQCLTVAPRTDALFVRRELPKTIWEHELDSPNRFKVKALCPPGSYAAKIEAERKILGELKKEWPKLSVLLLESPEVIPYPPLAYAVLAPYYLSDPQHGLGPVPLADKVSYLSRLAEAAEKARVHVNPVWEGSPDRRKEFLKDLNAAIAEAQVPTAVRLRETQ